jgi:hypothetical protein
MSSQLQNYRLVTLNDRVVPGFAGIMRESVREKNPSDRELRVVVASPSRVSESKVIKFAKKVTKHERISRAAFRQVESADPAKVNTLRKCLSIQRAFRLQSVLEMPETSVARVRIGSGKACRVSAIRLWARSSQSTMQ